MNRPILLNAFNFRSMISRTLLVLSALLILVGCSNKEVIVHNLDEGEANGIIVFLNNNGIVADKVEAAEATGGGTKVVLWNITVDKSETLDAMQLLRANGLPRRSGSNLLNIFNKGGLVPSEMEEKIRYQSGLGDQIANTIRKIDGVVDAEVTLSFPEDDPLNPTAIKLKPTASVYVKHTGILDDPNSQLISKIRRLVASSVQGLDYDNVTVIPDRARFSEMPQRPLNSRTEDRDYVDIWSIVVAKDSSTRFQAIFLSFVILLLLLLISLIWAIWKIFPIIKEHGGMKSFFEVHQYGAPAVVEKTEEEEKPAEEPKDKPPEDGEAT
jgi:type III secretion protein J